MCYKGIVMDITDKYIIVISDSGKMHKIKFKNGASIGDFIFFCEKDILKNENKSIRDSKWYFPLYAVALILFVVITQLNMPLHTAYAIVTLDINPSIEIEVNNSNNVISINNLKKHGKSFNFQNLKGKPLDEAVKSISQSVAKDNTIASKEAMIVGFTFIDENHSKSFEDNVQSTIAKNFSNMDIVYFSGTISDKKESLRRGLSLGRYKANKEINDDIIEDKIKDAPVTELIDILEKKGTPTYINKKPKVVPKAKNENINNIDETNKTNTKDEKKTKQTKEVNIKSTKVKNNKNTNDKNNKNTKNTNDKNNKNTNDKNANSNNIINSYKPNNHGNNSKHHKHDHDDDDDDDDDEDDDDD